MADRYRSRMQLPIVASEPAAISSASSWPSPKMSSKPLARSSSGCAFWLSTKASPSPGVCQSLAKSCHT